MFLNALKKISDFMDMYKIPYMVFGGIANSIHGNPRQTFDIDIKVNIDLTNSFDDFVFNLQKIATLLVKKTQKFCKRY